MEVCRRRADRREARRARAARRRAGRSRRPARGQDARRRVPLLLQRGLARRIRPERLPTGPLGKLERLAEYIRTGRSSLSWIFLLVAAGGDGRRIWAVVAGKIAGGARRMTLADPFWLVLAIPLAMSLWLWRLPSRLMLALRCAAPDGAAAGPVRPERSSLPVRSGTVVLVADRSLSMPPGSEALQKEAADIVHSAMRVRRQAGGRVVRRNGGGRAIAAGGQVRRLLGRSRPRGLATWPTRSTWRCR